MKAPKFLIVEDEGLIAYDLSNIVKKMGYDVAGIVDSGEEALIEVERTEPDCVLMDVVLNGSMDGIEAAKEINSRYAIPVVFITAYSDKALVERAKEAEPYGYILKPFREREIEIVFQMTLERHKLKMKLVESEKKYRVLVNNIPDFLYSLDDKGNISSVNEENKYIEKLGYSADELTGSPFLEFIFKEDRKMVVDSFVSAMKDRREYTKGLEFRIISEDGMMHWFELHSHMHFDKNGEYIREDGVLREITDRKRMEEELTKHATIDMLTGVYNRRIGLIMLENQLQLSKRNKTLLAVCFIDIDNLKKVNDSYGHQYGDILIKEVSGLLQELTRKSDILFRLGGDEFLIVLPGCSIEGSLLFWERTIHKLEEQNSNNSLPFIISISHGFAYNSEEKEMTVDEIVASADNQMFSDKKSRSNSK